MILRVRPHQVLIFGILCPLDMSPVLGHGELPPWILDRARAIGVRRGSLALLLLKHLSSGH